MNQRQTVVVCGLACVGLACGCGSSANTGFSDDGGTGGAAGSVFGAGGSTKAAAGGTGAGGSTKATGGSTGAGASTAAGGSTAAAGSTGAGGSTGTTNRGCNKVFYSGEPGEITLLDCGKWSDPKTMPDGVTSTFAEITDAPYAGTTSLQISLTQVPGTYGTDWGLAFGNWNVANAIDASKATDMVVWMKADHQTGGFNLWLTDSNKGVSTYYQMPTLGTDWTEIRVPMSHFTKAGFDPTLADTLASDMHDDGHGGVVWYLDEGVFEIPCP
jgi:hypothetical protein